MSDEADLIRIEEWLSGCISDADFALLEKRLSESSELRSQLRAMADLEAGLRRLALTPEVIVT
ncbi:MAG: hypothetical protein WCK17_11285, partial [Verrucomicrobiota bacterium]